jgi:hypothetical protein
MAACLHEGLSYEFRAEPKHILPEAEGTVSVGPRRLGAAPPAGKRD